MTYLGKSTQLILSVLLSFFIATDQILPIALPLEAQQKTYKSNWFNTWQIVIRFRDQIRTGDTIIADDLVSVPRKSLREFG